MYGKYIFGENLKKHHIKIIYYTSGDNVSSALLFEKMANGPYYDLPIPIMLQHYYVSIKRHNCMIIVMVKC